MVAHFSSQNGTDDTGPELSPLIGSYAVSAVVMRRQGEDPTLKGSANVNQRAKEEEEGTWKTSKHS